jgi:putative addiction module component (TIGR02574 family)
MQEATKAERNALWLVSCSALLDGALRRSSSSMGKTGQKVLDEALQLDLSERAELAAELLASLDGEPEAEVEAAWAAEIERRASRARSGEDPGRPWAEARGAARDALSNR